ncbi:hypothetical protein COCSUDRAFT_33996 [Coccomyxa subellipsoidea C-169]|uniref:Uncharacterized protein n=1 Tax=Coccomyxa subellipsoidea (strain C-169) TaxID=574566 RepID=I0YQ51_COCSC|nr:hypothetical protein COCSUDRAFT_33996 [Coccomyxa subellipsoidea C-169]EIE20520.1 hypothetical protein COCSUDRAFT_33996 [Coccomyxa subellipsoidea C-169]|eukprot:XP_005645064.1 hypothetical protein COCSUDRAFT_33996 [Coccomyxa subellipsoidea C-169]
MQMSQAADQTYCQYCLDCETKSRVLVEQVLIVHDVPCTPDHLSTNVEIRDIVWEDVFLRGSFLGDAAELHNDRHHLKKRLDSTSTHPDFGQKTLRIVQNFSLNNPPLDCASSHIQLLTVSGTGLRSLTLPCRIKNASSFGSS